MHWLEWIKSNWNPDKVNLRQCTTRIVIPLCSELDRALQSHRVLRFDLRFKYLVCKHHKCPPCPGWITRTVFCFPFGLQNNRSRQQKHIGCANDKHYILNIACLVCQICKLLARITFDYACISLPFIGNLKLSRSLVNILPKCLITYALKVQYGDGCDIPPALQTYKFKCIRLRHSC